jgi:tRNA(fMet)-specific endonuclease VapC
MFLLDTEHIVVLQTKTQPAYGNLNRRMNQHPPTAFYYSIVSLHEQFRGAHAYINSATKPSEVIRGYEMLQRALESYCNAQVSPFDQLASNQFDAPRSQGVRIGTFDLRIASIALVRGFAVLTSNTRDFCQVPGLMVEDWTV